jgi:phage-related protein (TIGR01555 family)
MKKHKKHKHAVHRDSKVSTTTQTKRLDAWANRLTGINFGSRAGSSKWCVDQHYDLSQAKLDSIYSKDGICKRIIDIYPEESLRTFVDADQRILEELERLKLKPKTFEASRDARLFGGSVVVAFIDDGRSLEDELDYENIDKLVHLKVFDRYKVTWFPTDLVTDPLDEDYGMPLFYTIQNNNFVTSDSVQFKVHKSRLFRFAGDSTTEFSKKNNQGWDNSCIVSLYKSIQSFGESMGVSAEIVQGYLETTAKIPGFTESFRDGEMGGYMRKRMDDFNSSKGAYKTIFLDGEEEYQKHVTNSHGLSEILDRFGEIISASCSIPVSVLFGRSAGGLNATGKQELDLMNNKIEEYRNNNIKPFFTWIFKILEAQKSFVSEAGQDLDFHWEFHPLVTLDEKKEAETRKLNAEVDRLYIEAGAVDAQTLFKLRYHAEQAFNNNIMFSKEDLVELEKKMNQQELEEEQLNERDIELLKDMEQEKLDKENKMNTDSQENQVKLRTAKLDEYIINGYLEKIEKHK